MSVRVLVLSHVAGTGKEMYEVSQISQNNRMTTMTAQVGQTKEHMRSKMLEVRSDNAAVSDALLVVRTAGQKQANHSRRENGSIFGASWMTAWRVLSLSTV